MELHEVITGLEKMMKTEQLSQESKRVLHEALSYMYRTNKTCEIFERLRKGDIQKYMTDGIIAFNSDYYRSNRWEQIAIMTR